MRYFSFIFIFLLCSCEYKKETLKYNKTYSVEVSKENDTVIEKEYVIYQKVERSKVIEVEPKDNIYMGVSLDNNYYNNDLEAFEKDINKELSLEVIYIDYDVTEYFLQKKILKAMVEGKIPYFVLKFQRNNSYDLERMKEFSKKIGDIKYYSFLEIYPIDESDKINQSDYKNFLQKSYSFIKENATLCSVVFPVKEINYIDFSNIYVGDSYCDFINVYANIDATSKAKNPLTAIEYVYYSIINKPIILSTSINYYTSKYGYDIEGYNNTLDYCFNKAKEEYSNLKALIFLDYNIDYSKDALYNLESNDEVFDIFKENINKSDFLTKAVKEYNENELVKLPYKAYYIKDELYIDTRYFKNFVVEKEEVTIVQDDKVYLSLEDFINRVNDKTVVVDSAENKIIIN
ncbi:MAG: hypothetical protein ACK5LY_03565 [Lachnospirales bacterium]